MKWVESVVDIWLHREAPEWDAREIVAMARSTLAGETEEQVRCLADQLHDHLSEAAKSLRKCSDGEVIANMVQAFSSLPEKLSEIGAQSEPLNTASLDDEILRHSLVHEFGPLIERHRSVPNDLHNTWMLSIVLNGGMPPDFAHAIPPDKLYAMLALYATAHGDVISAYKFALGERNDLRLQVMELAPYAEHGVKNHTNLKKGRDVSAETRSKARQENERAWREKAIEMWPDHPGYTLEDMAKEIKKQLGSDAAVGTIKKALKGVKSTVFKTREEEIKDEKRQDLAAKRVQL
jgi:hypothetical protein